MKRRRTAVLFATAFALAGVAACGGGDPVAAPAAQLSTPATTSPEPTASASPDGTWTTDRELTSLVTDGTVIVGLTRGENPVQAVALSPDDGTEAWAGPLPAPDGATVSEAATWLAPGGPVVVSYEASTPGTGLTPPSNGPHVAALDPTTGKVLWDRPAPGPGASVSKVAVLIAADEDGDFDPTTVALDPATGNELWTYDSGPLLVRDDVAVLETEAGVSTVLTGVDARTGARLWSSEAWNVGAVGSRSFVHAALPGRAVIETTVTALQGETTTMRVRDLRTGEPVGEELPTPNNVEGLTDPTTGVAIVYDDSGAANQGVYAVDLSTGRKLWELGVEQSTAAFRAGEGLVWVSGADGVVAVDALTGQPRAQGLTEAPVLVLPGAQIRLGPVSGLVAESLP